MAAPRIEYPALSRRHVDRAASAVEDDRRVGDHWNVNAYPGVPVIVEIHMGRDFAAGLQPHQPRAPQHFAEAGHGLLRVCASPQMRGDDHVAVKGVVVAAISGDEGNR